MEQGCALSLFAPKGGATFFMPLFLVKWIPCNWIFSPRSRSHLRSFWHQFELLQFFWKVCYGYKLFNVKLRWRLGPISTQKFAQITMDPLLRKHALTGLSLAILSRFLFPEKKFQRGVKLEVRPCQPCCRRDHHFLKHRRCQLSSKYMPFALL